MSKNKLDPRIIRTRKLLREALIALVAEQGYDKIMIQDIAERATLNRATFYLHYKEKDELLYDCAQVLFEEMLAGLQLRNTPPTEMLQRLNNPETLIPLFQHFKTYAHFYKVVLGAKGVPSFATSVREYFADTFKSLMMGQLRTENTGLSEVMVHFISAGILGLVAWWLENDLPYSPEAMSANTLQLVSRLTGA